MGDARTYGTDRISGSERIASLDVIRGIAILFILFMNIPAMGSYMFSLHDPRIPTWTTADQWSFVIQFTTLNGTQRGLLELLFGAGIMIMARRAMTPDGPVEVADLHYRRNLLLIVLGGFNAFVLMWWGDILLTYGIAAVFLFPFRRLGPRAQCGLAAVFLAALLAYSYSDYRDTLDDRAAPARVAALTAAHKPVPPELKSQADDWQKHVAHMRTPANKDPKRVKDVEKERAQHLGGVVAYAKVTLRDWLGLMGYFWVIEAEIVATMLIGMALYQWGVIQGRARTSTYALMVVVGYGIGFLTRGSLALMFVQSNPDPHWQVVIADLDRLLVTFGHVGLIHLALRTSAGQALLKPFQAAGRMPLTVYLFTSLLMMWVVFPGVGLGLFGRWGFAQLMGLAALIIAAEVIATNLWLTRFETGPMEWLWKSLAYLRRQPFRKAAPEPLPPGLVPAE